VNLDKGRTGYFETDLDIANAKKLFFMASKPHFDNAKAHGQMLYDYWGSNLERREERVNISEQDRVLRRKRLKVWKGA
jgi:hypothetical protein